VDKISKKLRIEAKMGGKIPAIRSVEEGTSQGVAEHWKEFRPKKS
jgi:hypothetical protein